MKKVGIRFLILVIFFFGTWYSISQVNWLIIFKVEKISNTTEEKLGDLFWDFFKGTKEEFKKEKILRPVDSLLSKLCASNGIDRDQIKLHVVDAKEVNAFALPNYHLVVFSGLIMACENEAELTGVLAHELSHLEMSHVMKKLVKEVGLSVLISMTAGNSGEIVKEATKLLSSSAYDRNLEKEADIRAVEYLIQAGISPEPFANFLYRLSANEANLTKHLNWVSTHPNSKDRAEYILEYSKSKNYKRESIRKEGTWLMLKKEVGE